MNEDADSTEAPNWLNELEAKRERRVKAKLGHETGAGAPCLTCNEKCPGLDLHFWRKICKNCKCSKENHDVPDEDIYGWAQFQLLGNKVNKMKKRIVLPGKKDEVELDWAPKGQAETVDRYLKSLPPDSLPVKGSKAAQIRKQLLQKQIPIHDLDPTLCHELTDSEQQKMQVYIDHMKQDCVGVGQVIQLGTSYLTNRYPKGVSAIEIVGLQAENLAVPLSKQLERMNVNSEAATGENAKRNLRAEDLNRLPPRNVPITNHEPVTLGGLRDVHYPYSVASKELDAFFDTVPNPVNMTAGEYNANLYHKNFSSDLPALLAERYPDYGAPKAEEAVGLDKQHNFPHYAPGKYNIYSDRQHPTQIGNIRDLAFSTYDPDKLAPNDLTNSNYSRQLEGGRKGLKSYTPAGGHDVIVDNLQPNPVNIGIIKDINYPGREPDVNSSVRRDAGFPDEPQLQPRQATQQNIKLCKKCGQPFGEGDFAIFVERSDSFYHSECFKCAGCNQSLADMVYFYDKESDDIFCGRDYAKIRGIPRCKACDELIFVKEYCLAENSCFHIKHFCCFECDKALAGQNYVVEDSQPLCLPCYEKVKANRCQRCQQVIKPDEQGVNVKGVHFHASDECFACITCSKPLMGAKLLLRSEQLYCSHPCYGQTQ